MEFSQETLTVVQYLDHASGHSLRKRNDITILLEIGSRTDSAEQFNKLVFYGKCLWNVYAIIRKTSPDAEGFAQIQHEFAENVRLIREELVYFAANADEDTTARFQNIYLGMNEGTLRNVVDLAHDLARLKDLQNDARH